MRTSLNRAGVIVVAGFAGVLVGCASKSEQASGSDQATKPDHPAQARATDAGSPSEPVIILQGFPGTITLNGDESSPANGHSKRPASVFAPLTLPTPSTVRTADGRPGPDYWQQQVDYVIEAELNEVDHQISGKATITYTNNSPHDLDYIWLHMEQNLFKDDSLGTLSSVPGARFSNRPDFKGGFRVESIKAEGKELPLHVYDTMARVDLPTPIPHKPKSIPAAKLGDPPVKGNGLGNQMTFEVAWSFTVPEYGVDRMGVLKQEQGEIFEIAQWFPAVAVFDDVYGWNTLPYLGQGEFYTNYGNFDVKLTVPRSHIVVATGTLQNDADVLTPTQMDRIKKARQTAETVMIRTADEVADPSSRPAGQGPLTWHFKAENTRTFAWASSPAFIWDGASVDGQAGTFVQSVYSKEVAPLWSKSTDMLRFSIEHYNTKWFVYPYPVATNVFGTVGGMEYPMIIFCGDTGAEEGLYGTTTHEIGHNWFPMVVNTDERRHAWMDEGFNTFINIYSEAARFHNGQPQRNGRDAAFMCRSNLPPMETAADQLGPGLLGELEYAKTGAALYALREAVLGPERFDRAFREYIARWAFKSPQPADFYRTMENVSGMDLSWFWRSWIIEARWLDQSIEGVDQRSDGQTATVTIGNHGDMVMPVSIRVTFDDGSTILKKLPVEVWFWTTEWRTDVPAGGKKVVKVEVDPDNMMPDMNPRNNMWTPAANPDEPASKAANPAH